MITWSGFFGETIKFAIRKIFDKKIDWRFDRKRYACRSFISLYDSMAELEILLANILDTFNPLLEGKRGIIHNHWMVKYSDKINKISKMFLENLHELGNTIEIYDHDLMRFLTAVELSSFGWVAAYSELSSSETIKLKIVIDENGKFVSLEYTTLKMPISYTEIESYFNNFKLRIEKEGNYAPPQQFGLPMAKDNHFPDDKKRNWPAS